ncbi:hypothetical protein [Exiguobacterium sp. s59]|uniref:hypothetical protein n=1 Tax=Exiguobacterium sp. s59 TaxID=2751269 RepID=UPI001BEB650C|nr:hypothetical protein [Exiguobacterium sp. s59]
MFKDKSKEKDEYQSEVVIEINPFLIIYKVRKTLLSKSFIYVWLSLVVAMTTLYVISIKSNYIIIDSFSISDFLAPAITGLSFTLALIVATTRLFSKEQLVDFYEYTDSDNPSEGYLFYRTIAPYIWTSTVWLVVSIGALFAKIFIFDIPHTIHMILKLSYSSIVLMGVMSLWSLLCIHIADVALETEREINDSKQSKSKDL